MSGPVYFDVESPLQSEVDAELDICCALYESISIYGAVPELRKLCERYGLWSTTASMESLSDVAATEALLGGIGTRIRGWIAKAMASIKATGVALKNKLIDGLVAVGDKLKTLAGKFVPDSIKKKVKAHPYATVAGAVGALVALGGVIAICTGALPLSGGIAAIPSASAAIQRAVSAINWPFGKFAAQAAGESGALKLVAQAAPAAETALREGTPASLGWGASALSTITSRLSSARSTMSSAATRLSTAFGGEATAATSGTQTAKAAGGWFKALRWGWSVVVLCFGLIRRIVGTVMEVLSKVLSVFGTVTGTIGMMQTVKSAMPTSQQEEDEEDGTAQTGNGQQATDAGKVG